MILKEKIKELRARFDEELAKAGTPEALESLRVAFLRVALCLAFAETLLLKFLHFKLERKFLCVATLTLFLE